LQVILLRAAMKFKPLISSRSRLWERPSAPLRQPLATWMITSLSPRLAFGAEDLAIRPLTGAC
jgi:hypothetical protein